MTMFKKFFREYSEDIEDLKERLNKQQEKLDSYGIRVSDMECENKKLKRVLENYIPGRITYKNISEYLTIFHRDRFNYLYLYKDGKEFCINNLKLNMPTFLEESDNDRKDVVCVNDYISTKNKTQLIKYVIDLDNCTYIRIK